MASNHFAIFLILLVLILGSPGTISSTASTPRTAENEVIPPTGTEVEVTDIPGTAENGVSSRGRWPSRDLCSMTTLDFGAEATPSLTVDEQELDQKLWQVVFGREWMDIESLDYEVSLEKVFNWAGRRRTLLDVKTVDAELSHECSLVIQAMDEDESHWQRLCEKAQEKKDAKKKLEAAATKMMAMHRDKIVKSGYQGNPNDSELYKLNQKTVDEWVLAKIDILEKAHRILADEHAQKLETLRVACVALYERAKNAYLAYVKSQDASMENVDDDLLKELQSLSIDEVPLSEKAPWVCFLNI